MPDRMGLILLVENLDQYEAAVKSVKSANDQVASSMEGVEKTGTKWDDGLKDLIGRMGGTKAAIGDLADASRKLHAPVAKSNKSMLAFAGAMAVGNIAAMAIVGTIKKVVAGFKQLIVVSTLIAARIEGLEDVLHLLGRRAGYTTEKLDGYVAALMDTGITQKASLQTLLQMIQSNIDLAHATDLARIAQDAAYIAGINSNEAFMRLIDAMQRGDPTLLKIMSMTVDFATAEEELATSLGTTKDALEPVERFQARVNAIMKEGEKIAGTYELAMGKAGKQITSIAGDIEDVQAKLGQLTLPSLSVLVTEYRKALAKIDTWLKDHEKELERWGKLLAEGIKAAITQVGLLIKELGKIPGAVETAGVSLASLFIGQKEAEERSKRLSEYWLKSLALLGAGLSLITVVIKTTVVELNELGKALVLLTPPGWIVVGFKALRGDLEDVKKTFREGFDPGGFRDAEAPMKAFEDTLLKLSIGFGLVEDASEDATDEIVDGLGKAEDAASKVTDEMKDMAEALTDLRLDLQRELVDDLIDEERKLLEQEIALARRREDIARKTAMAIAGAYADAATARADLAAEAAEDRTEFERDATEEWADLEQDAARNREDMDRDYADRRIDIEIATRRRLQDIQRQFEMSVKDAARTRDAFALVQAQRRAASDRGAALRGRDEQLADAKTAHERQERDFAISLAEQREDLRKSLAEQEADLVASLAERQQDIERQLRAQLASIEEANRLEAEDRARQMAREREDMALQAKWEQEDRTRRLMRQLQDMEIQYGDLGDITAEGLMEQVRDWADTYGPEGAAAQIVTDFSTIVQEQAQLWAEAIEKATRSLDVFDSKLTRPRSLDLRLNIPPELELHSPKLGLQIGFENLEKMLARQPMPAFMAGGLPAAPGAARTETYSRTEAQHDINMSIPGDLDLVVQRQLAGVLTQTFKGVS